MAQQTQIRTIVPYYERFIERFPTIQSLAQADLQDVLKIWEGLGYYGRTRNLFRSAQILAKRFPCRLPNRKSELLKLPGIGDYIASAISSVAFGQPHAAVDANVYRVLSRTSQLKAPINHPASAKLFKAVADRLIPISNPGDYNQAVMELGALICNTKQPDCASCPIRIFCEAYQKKTTAQFPVKRKPKPKPTYHVAIAVITKKDRLLITKRKREGLLGGMWEFPGGKIKVGESPREACIREVKEEVNLLVEIDRPIQKFSYAYTHFRVHLNVFLCKFVSGRVRLRSPVAHKWIPLSEIDRFPFPGANKRFIPKLREIIALQ